MCSWINYMYMQYCTCTIMYKFYHLIVCAILNYDIVPTFEPHFVTSIELILLLSNVFINESVVNA